MYWSFLMPDALAAVFPMLFCFSCGVFCRSRQLLGDADAATLLRVVFLIGLPALILSTIPQIQITRQLALLPLLAVAIHLITGAAFLLMTRSGKISPLTRTTGLIGVMMMNLGFVFPFVEATLGTRGLQIAFLFDLGNAIFVFTIGYTLATRAGRTDTRTPVWKQLITAPPLIALAAALFMNRTGMALPAFLKDTTEFLGKAAFPLILIALGLHFRPKKIRLPSALGVFCRMAGGFGCAWFLTFIFGISGLNRDVILICAAAPVGFNTLTFSVLCDLDTQTAAEMVSAGVGMGLVATPLLLWLLT